jgi:hypothetical protein
MGDFETDGLGLLHLSGSAQILKPNSVFDQLSCQPNQVSRHGDTSRRKMRLSPSMPLSTTKSVYE